jgi:hypothetical protein
LQSKEIVLLLHEISYPDSLNCLSKLLNNFFMLKSYGITENLICFLEYKYFLYCFMKKTKINKLDINLALRWLFLLQLQIDVIKFERISVECLR